MLLGSGVVPVEVLVLVEVLLLPRMVNVSEGTVPMVFSWAWEGPEFISQYAGSPLGTLALLKVIQYIPGFRLTGLKPAVSSQTPIRRIGSKCSEKPPGLTTTSSKLLPKAAEPELAPRRWLCCHPGSASPKRQTIHGSRVAEGEFVVTEKPKLMVQPRSCPLPGPLFINYLLCHRRNRSQAQTERQQQSNAQVRISPPTRLYRGIRPRSGRIVNGFFAQAVTEWRHSVNQGRSKDRLLPAPCTPCCLRSLPFHDAGQLLLIQETHPQAAWI